ncbi:MAG: hypothetical protein R2769_10430 [Saprospiraceae bacterium]
MAETKALNFAGISGRPNRKRRNYKIENKVSRKSRQDFISKGRNEYDQEILNENSKIFDLNQQYDSLKTYLEFNYPEYYKLKYDLSTISLGEVQEKLLKPEQTLIEYFVGDSSIFIFTVQKDNYNVAEVKLDFPLETWVYDFQSGVYEYYKKIRMNGQMNCLKDT